MKHIEAVISVSYLEEIKEVLRNIGIDDVVIHHTVRNGSGGKKAVFIKGAQCVSGLVTRIKVEIVAADELVGKVIDAIAEIAGRESRGICRIFIHPLAGAEV